MGEGQVRRLPRRLRHAGGVELPGGHDDLGQLAVDHVAVDVDVGDLVEGPDRLQRQEGTTRRLGRRVPQPDVVEGGLRLGGEVLGGEVDVGHERGVLDLVEPHRGAGGGDVVGDVLPLARQLRRLRRGIAAPPPARWRRR